MILGAKKKEIKQKNLICPLKNAKTFNRSTNIKKCVALLIVHITIIRVRLIIPNIPKLTRKILFAAQYKFVYSVEYLTVFGPKRREAAATPSVRSASLFFVNFSPSGIEWNQISLRVIHVTRDSSVRNLSYVCSSRIVHCIGGCNIYNGARRIIQSSSALCMLLFYHLSIFLIFYAPAALTITEGYDAATFFYPTNRLFVCVSASLSDCLSFNGICRKQSQSNVNYEQECDKCMYWVVYGMSK